jgi:hypothetical protein
VSNRVTPGSWARTRPAWASSGSTWSHPIGTSSLLLAGPPMVQHRSPPASGPTRGGTVPALPPARLPRPLAEPGVRLSTHRALHGLCRQAVPVTQGMGILLPRYRYRVTGIAPIRASSIFPAAIRNQRPFGVVCLRRNPARPALHRPHESRHHPDPCRAVPGNRHNVAILNTATGPRIG